MAERDGDKTTLQQENESLSSLFSRLTDELTQLFDAKLELAKAEIKEQVGAYAVGVALILVGALIATVGFALLNVAIAFLISMLFDTTRWSPPARYGIGFGITALLYLGIGGILVVTAKNRLGKQHFVPKTAADLKRDKEFLKQEF